MAVVAGLMSKTIQYTYGVIGAAESSTTSAKLLVPAGTPAQSSGGLTGLPPAQVYRSGIAFCRNAPLLTVITLGVASVMPDPHPAIDRAQPTATTAAATRRMRRARGALPARPGPVPSTRSPPLPDLRPWRQPRRPGTRTRRLPG